MTPAAVSSGSAPATGDPIASLPSARMLAVAVACGTIVASGFALVDVAGASPERTIPSAIAGAGVVTLIALAGIAMLAPWKARLVSTWMTWWLALTVFRVFLTPVAAWVLYSAASELLNPRPFALAVALAYLTTVVAEALVVSLHLRTIVLPREAATGPR